MKGLFYGLLKLTGDVIFGNYCKDDFPLKSMSVLPFVPNATFQRPHPTCHAKNSHSSLSSHCIAHMKQGPFLPKEKKGGNSCKELHRCFHTIIFTKSLAVYLFRLNP